MEKNKELAHFGINDEPTENDLLENDVYAEGLYNFILKCSTPMSIAIQGDWGSGKTSLLNSIESKLKKSGIEPVFINTWRYSQIVPNDEKLSNIFLTAVCNKISNKKASKAADKVEKIAKAVATFAMNAATGTNTGQIVADVCNFSDRAMLVESLREDFGKEIDEKAANGRIVILVDDLDRLNPQVAVELLENIKLFMDVPKCVFVLAIDYDVVVQGVRGKYGESMSMEKCRSFFDKIIQLPFQMPIQKYELRKMIDEYFPNAFDAGHIEHISIFAKKAINSSPRSLKRVVNSFALLKTIQNCTSADADSVDNAMLFCALCIQIRHKALYDYLFALLSDSEPEEWAEKENPLNPNPSELENELSKYLDLELQKEENKIERDVQIGQLQRLLNDLEMTLEKICESENDEERAKKYKKFADVITRTSTTNRENATAELTAFWLTKEQKEQVKANDSLISKEPAMLRDLAGRIRESVNVSSAKPLYTTPIVKWLMEKGCLYKNEADELHATTVGTHRGIISVEKPSSSSVQLLYNESAQRFILQHIEEWLT